MAEAPTKVTVKTITPAPVPTPQGRDWPSFSDLRREIDSLFEDFTRDWFGAPARQPRFAFNPFGRSETYPAADVVENDGGYKITLELPGMTEKDVTVELAGDVLTIKGEKSETKEENEKGRHVSERRYGAFERSFTLPGDIEKGMLRGIFTNGLLTVELPKTAAAKVEPTRIDVRAA